MLTVPVLVRAMPVLKADRWAALLLLLVLLVSPAQRLVGASFSIGLRQTWRGMQEQQKAAGGKGDQGPAITVHYPNGGEVRTYEWSAVRPFLWAYVCRLCAHFPHRCHGDTHMCRLNWRGKRGRHHQKLSGKN